MENLVVVITFSLLYWKHSFWVNLVQKSKLPVLPEIWYLDLFEHEEFSGGVYFFCFILEKPSLVNEEKWSAIQKQPSRGVLRKVVLKICSKFTGEHPCRSVILIKCFGRLLMAIITFATCESWDFDIGTCHQHGFFILLQHGVIIPNYNIITPWLQWVRPWIAFVHYLKKYLNN